MVTDPVRLRQIAVAVISGRTKREFGVRTSQESYAWDRFVADVLDLKTRGETPVLPKEKLTTW